MSAALVTLTERAIAEDAAKIAAHVLRRLIALVARLLQRAQADRLEAWVHAGTHLRRRNRLVGDLLEDDPERILRGERHATDEQLIEDDADRIEV